MPWTRLAIAERCGNCDTSIAPHALAYVLRVGPPRRVRCQPCGELACGYCLLGEPEGDDRFKPLPQQPSGFAPVGQLVITQGQLLARNERRAEAIARAQERRR